MLRQERTTFHDLLGRRPTPPLLGVLPGRRFTKRGSTPKQTEQPVTSSRVDEQVRGVREVPSKAVSQPWQGAQPLPTLASVGVGLALWTLVPVPEGISQEAWTLLSIFLSTIVGLVLEPLPVSAWALVGVTVALLTQCLTFEQAFSAMTNEVVWLIVVSFFFAKAFEKTGLGERVACVFVSRLGRTPLGLAMGLTVAEAMLAPAMPSTSARAGGVFMPVIKSLSDSVGSHPSRWRFTHCLTLDLSRCMGSQRGDSSRNKIGAFLTQCQFQVSAQSSNLFLTAAAQNLLCLKLAASVGAPVEDPFLTWAYGASVPGIIGLLATPLLVFRLQPPELISLREAPRLARKKLKEMGPLTGDELIMMITMMSAVTLWVLGAIVGISPVEVALLGLCVLILTGTLTWEDCVEHNPAWDTLTWFAVLISMSTALNDQGVVQVFADQVGGVLLATQMDWLTVFYLLHLVFFLLHYLFASQTAHVGALYAAFCSMMITAGVPAPLAALSLAYNVNLFGSITHYASGQAAVYYGGGYLRLKEMFSVGAVVGLASLALWGTVGMGWWKVLGWW